MNTQFFNPKDLDCWIAPAPKNLVSASCGPIEALNDKMEVVQVFKSIKETATVLHVAHTTVKKALGSDMTVKGFYLRGSK